MKNVIMSMGRGKIIVEFFSAEMVFNVFRREREKTQIRLTLKKIMFLEFSPEDISVEGRLASRQ
jgi:hypothetical protein